MSTGGKFGFGSPSGGFIVASTRGPVLLEGDAEEEYADDQGNDEEVETGPALTVVTADGPAWVTAAADALGVSVRAINTKMLRMTFDGFTLGLGVLLSSESSCSSKP